MILLSVFLVAAVAQTTMTADGPKCTELKAMCGDGKCSSMTDAAARRTCATNCLTLSQACAAEKLASASTRWTDAMTKLEMARTTWQTKIDAWKTASVDQIKMGCNAVCTAQMAQLGDKFDMCTATCNGITDFQSGMAAFVAFLQSTMRAKLDALRDMYPDKVAEIEAAGAALRDSVAMQRSLFMDAQAKLADALDARQTKIADLKAAREAKIEAVKQRIASCKADLAAATSDADKESVKMTCRAMLDQAIADAKAALLDARAAWADKKKMIVDKIKAFNAARREGRQAIIADIKDLKGSVADLKKAVQATRSAAEMAGVEVEETAPGTKKRAGPSCTVVASCAVGDDLCAMQLNTAIAPFVTAETNVEMTAVSNDELNYATPDTTEFGGAIVKTTTAAVTDKTKNSASAAVLSVGVVLLAALAF